MALQQLLARLQLRLLTVYPNVLRIRLVRLGIPSAQAYLVSAQKIFLFLMKKTLHAVSLIRVPCLILSPYQQYYEELVPIRRCYQANEV